MVHTMNTTAPAASAAHFPDRGPVADNGKEILLSLDHVDIHFGKGDSLFLFFE